MMKCLVNASVENLVTIKVTCIQFECKQMLLNDEVKHNKQRQKKNYDK